MLHSKYTESLLLPSLSWVPWQAAEWNHPTNKFRAIWLVHPLTRSARFSCSHSVADSSFFFGAFLTITFTTSLPVPRHELLPRHNTYLLSPSTLMTVRPPTSLLCAWPILHLGRKASYSGWPDNDASEDCGGLTIFKARFCWYTTRAQPEYFVEGFWAIEGQEALCS